MSIFRLPVAHLVRQTSTRAQGAQTRLCVRTSQEKVTVRGPRADPFVVDVVCVSQQQYTNLAVCGMYDVLPVVCIFIRALIVVLHCAAKF